MNEGFYLKKDDVTSPSYQAVFSADGSEFKKVIEPLVFSKFREATIEGYGHERMKDFILK